MIRPARPLDRHRPRRSTRRWIAAVVALIAGPATAQMRDADADASAALARVIEVMRAEPLVLDETLAITTRQGELEETSPERTVRWSWMPGHGLAGRFDGYRVALADEALRVIHESSADLVVDMPDRGSPYYALFGQFRDLPWPGLALLIGAEKPSDCAMQMLTRAPWLQPTGVEEIEATDESPARRRILFTSDLESMWLEVDPETDLPLRSEVVIHDGPFVRDGIEIIYRHAFVVDRATPPDPKVELEFGIDGRSRVDMVAALVRPAPPARGPANALRAGRAAPDFDLPGLEDGRIRLADLKGRVVVLDFWATWCGPCRAAMPRMAELGRWARENGIPVEVVAVNTSEQSRDLETRLKRLGEFLPQQAWNLDGLRIALDRDGKVAGAFGVRALPTTVVLDADGRVVSTKSGFGPGSEEALRDLLLDLFEGGDDPGVPIDDVS